MKRFSFLFLLSLFVLPLFALRFEGSETIEINEDVHEDVYVAGGKVTINGKVYGDVFAMGGEVVLNDSIFGDVMAGGGEISINSFVEDDVRAVGGQVFIRTNIHGDVLLAGGEVEIAESSTIDGDLIGGCGELLLYGDVRGNAKLGVGEFEHTGTLDGRLELKAEEAELNGTVHGTSQLVAKSIRLGSQAQFNDDVRYWTRDGEMDFGSALSNGTLTYDTNLKSKHGTKKEEKKTWKSSFFKGIWYLISMGLLAALLHFLFGKAFVRAARLGEENMGNMAVRGFLFFIVTPVLAVMLLISVFGIPIGLLIGGLYAFAVALAKILSASVGAHWLRERQGAAWGIPLMAAVTVVFLLLFKALNFIPLLGWIASFGLVCVAFGALYTAFRERNLSV